MEENNQKKSLKWTAVIIFIILIGGLVYLFSKKILNNQKQISDINLIEQYQKTKDQISSYEDELKKDNFGGKTPEETLSLFIKALEAGNIDEAGNYFLNDAKNSKKMWQEALLKSKEEGNLSQVINLLKKAEYEKGSSSEDTAWFSVKNKEGLAEYSIVLKLNKYTNVWKIKEM